MPDEESGTIRQLTQRKDRDELRVALTALVSAVTELEAARGAAEFEAANDKLRAALRKARRALGPDVEPSSQELAQAAPDRGPNQTDTLGVVTIRPVPRRSRSWES